MIRRNGFVVLCVAMLWAGAAGAAPTGISLYGIGIGEPIKVPECAAGDGSISQQCYRKGSDFLPPTDPHAMRRVYIRFPVATSIMKYDEFDALIADDSVHEIAILTKGIEVQQEVLRLLTEKFGEPTKREAQRVQNKLGATFEVEHAYWRIHNIDVNFDGAVSNLDSGLIFVTTPEARAFDSDKQKRDRKTEPQL